MAHVGFIGLGKMGSNMVKLLSKKHKVVGYDLDANNVLAVKKYVKPASSIEDLCSKLPKQKIIWLMVPHQVVDLTIKELMKFLNKGDIVIDGGNSFFENSKKRYAKLKKKGIHFLDAGVSGGQSGALKGSSIMVGGDLKIYRKVEPIFKQLAIKDGYGYMGKAGAGHFVKMVHNGVEYSLLQAYGEGFQMLYESKYNIRLNDVNKVWRHGSVIRSWLLDITQPYFDRDPKLKKISGIACGGSTGEWTIKTAKKMKVKVPSIELALKERIKSRKKPTFSSKIVAVMRNAFGGHIIPKKRC